MKNKIHFTILLVFFNCFLGFSQEDDFIFQSLSGLNKVSEAAEKLWSFFDSTDDKINKKKLIDMAVDLNLDITDIIIEKQRILSKIQNSSTQETNLYSEINNLELKTIQLKNTLQKHKDVIKAVGLDAAEISSELKAEFSSKIFHLQTIKANPKRKQKTIVYLQSGINILKGAKSVLNKFKLI